MKPRAARIASFAIAAIMLVPIAAAGYMLATYPMELPGVVILVGLAAIAGGIGVAELREALR